MGVIFLTGVTGNLGSEILAFLLEECSHSIHVLVRAGSYREAAERVERIALFQGISEERIQERVVVHVGNLSEPEFGLSRLEYESLAQKTEYVIHSAAYLSLKQSWDVAEKAIVEPTNQVIELLNRAPRGRGIAHVSTVGVAGMSSQAVPEKLFFEEQNFRNNYERAKALCERHIVQNLRSDLKKLILRPSMIIGRQGDGHLLQPQIFQAIVQLLSGELTGGYVPDLSSFQIDTIPVDVVSRALALLFRDKLGSDPTVLHLCSGPDASLTFPRIEMLLQKVQGLRGEEQRPIRRLSLDDFKAALPAISEQLSVDQLRGLSFLPFFFDYLHFNQQFENESSKKLLVDIDVQIPSPEESVLSTIRFLLRKPSRRARKSIQRAGSEAKLL